MALRSHLRWHLRSHGDRIGTHTEIASEPTLRSCSDGTEPTLRWHLRSHLRSHRTSHPRSLLLPPTHPSSFFSPCLSFLLLNFCFLYFGAIPLLAAERFAGNGARVGEFSCMILHRTTHSSLAGSLPDAGIPLLATSLRRAAAAGTFASGLGHSIAAFAAAGATALAAASTSYDSSL